jgi:hypothetical protein
MKNYKVDKFLLLGNLTFGGFAVIFWTLFLFCHTSMVIPIILTSIQFLFLLSQFIYSKNNG